MLLHEPVVAQACRRPDAVAVRQWGERLTYRELFGAAAAVAGALRDAGVGPETIVGVAARRRPPLAAAILGVLLAGGAYLALDLDLPVRRLADTLDDAGAAVLVADDTGRALLGTGRRVVPLDAPGAGRLAGCPARPDSAACVLHTSGSTGRPRAVVLTHRNVATMAAALSDLLGVDERSRVLGFASQALDVSVAELFVALSAGAELQLAPEADRADPARLQRFCAEHRVTWGDLPVGLLPLLEPERLPDWRFLTTGGEAPDPEQVERWTASGRRFLNCYGPAEATVQVTAFEASGRWERPLPIGRPLTGQRVHVVEGELLAGGSGLARGYLGRPDQTAERFVPDPFGPPGERLYRTGDLVVREPDGGLRLVGRRDRQVKVRGHRVEPAEVEAALRRHPRVDRAAVEALPGPELVAFVTPAAAPGPAELRAWCAERLPAAMVPARAIRLDALPALPSGKVDRAALRAAAAPGPQAEPADPQVAFTAGPRGPGAAAGTPRGRAG